MGTLFEQPLRVDRIKAITPCDILTELEDLQEEYPSLSFDQLMAVIQLAMERTEAGSRLLDRDISDEMWAGIGELFLELIEAIRGDGDGARLSLVK